MALRTITILDTFSDDSVTLTAPNPSDVLNAIDLWFAADDDNEYMTGLVSEFAEAVAAGTDTNELAVALGLEVR